MRRTGLLLLALVVFSWGARGVRADVVAHPENFRYLSETVTGSDLVLTGFGSIVPAKNGVFDYTADLQALRANHVRYARVWTLQLDPGLEPWAINDSGPYQTGDILWDWNPEYWRRLRDALGQADSEDSDSVIYAEVMLFDTRCRGFELLVPAGQCNAFLRRDDPWRELQELWVNKLLSETNFKNVFYEVQNEPRGTFAEFVSKDKVWTTHWAAVAKHSRALPVAVAINPPGDDPGGLSAIASWLGDVDVLNFHPSHEQEDDLGALGSAIAAYALLGRAVSLDEYANCRRGNDEPCSVDEVDFDLVRRAGWVALASGGHFHIEDIVDGHSDPSLVATLMANLKAFKERWQFRRFGPTEEPLLSAGGGPLQRFCTKGSRASGRIEYVCYLPDVPASTDQVAVTLPPAPPAFGGWKLSLWDPRGPGDDYSAVYYSADDRSLLVELPPGGTTPRRDWVFHVDSDQRYPLTLTRSGSGSGVVRLDPPGTDCAADCRQQYRPQTLVHVTALAAPDSTFAGWSGGGCQGAGSVCALTMDAAQSVVAEFALKTFVLTVSRAGSGSGSVSSSPSGIDCGTTCSQAFTVGTAVTLTASAGTGSDFAGWSGDCATVNGNTCQVSVLEARLVTATFVLRTYTFTLTKAGAGSGSVTSDPPGLECGPGCSSVTATYAYGARVTLSMVPDPGWAFVAWSGSCQGTQSQCAVTVTAPAVLTARFDAPIASPALQYFPLKAPCRVLDTRTSGGPLQHGVPRSIQVTGACVPAGAQSVATVLTVVAPTGAGTLQMNGGPLTTAAVANFPAAGGAWASSAVTSLSSGGQVTAQAALLGGGSTQLIIDATGYFAAPAASGQEFVPAVSPWRLVDANVTGGQAKVFDSGSGGSALAVSVAAVDTPAAGHLSVYPVTTGANGTSTLNYATGSRLYNGTIIRLTATPLGDFATLSLQGHRLLVDVNGVFAAPAAGTLRYHAIAPCRILDTRIAGGLIQALEVRPLQVRGLCGAIPGTARAVAANLAVVGAGGVGHLQFWASGAATPSGAQLLYQQGWTIGTGALLPLSPDPGRTGGELTVTSIAATHLVVDVTGYFSPAP